MSTILPLTPRVYHVHVINGSDSIWTVNMRNNDGSIPDLTGWIPSAQAIRVQGPSYGSVLSDPLSENPIPLTCTIGSDKASVVISVASGTTKTVKPGKFGYDVVITSADGSIKQAIIRGMLTVDPSFFA